ncbi:hypothetical protein Pla8534_49600 [Lignipirellula cremea]|uniref:Uncharacterized protein n=1 Tax=Lignipirellula cremea TaxID=2528010 RepID=A0A518DZ73_9BACT|nr:hypothetical protein Pla8534_49600 [Lignipirellula cremea]
MADHPLSDDTRTALCERLGEAAGNQLAELISRMASWRLASVEIASFFRAIPAPS